jgi:hypothetical protein
MPRTISATMAAREFREVLDAVEHAGETFRIERHGSPVDRMADKRPCPPCVDVSCGQ